MSDEERQSRLAPGFHSTEVLYRGSASTVYRALRDGDDSPVALKVMRDDHGTREADRLVELSGTPGLVTALGGGRTSSGRAFVAMDLHPEGDYASASEDRGPLPLEEVLGVGRAVASALAALHARGLLHHRIEPGNILRTPDGAVLADVGGVLPEDQRPEPVGLEPVAVAYASPEALSGIHPLTPASDVYRLATVLWTLLAGYPPFAPGPGAVGDPFAYRERVLAEDPPRLPRADLPGSLREVLDRALSRDPAERQDAAALAAALGGGQDGGAGTGSASTAVPPPAVPAPVEPPATELSPVEAPAVEPPAAVAPATAPEPGPEPGHTTPGSAERFLADRPELAWASLPGWAGTTAAAPPAAAPPASAPPSSAPPTATPPTVAPEQAVPGYHWEHSPPRAPEPPEPPKAPETGPRPLGPGPRRPLFIGVTVAAIAFVAVTLGAVAVLRPSFGGDLLDQVRQGTPVSPEASDTPAGAQDGAGVPRTDDPQDGRSDAPTPAAGLVEASAPTGLSLEDTGHTVLVSWTDNTDPAAAHQVVGGPAGESPGNLADAEPGTERVAVSGLEVGREYCFIVIAVLSVDEIAPSDQVCTERTTTG